VNLEESVGRIIQKKFYAPHFLGDAMTGNSFLTKNF